MSGSIYFGYCLQSYLNAIDLIGECQFDQAKAALNEAIRWDQVYWQEADMPIGCHITEQCATAAKAALEAIKVAEMYREARDLVNQKVLRGFLWKAAVSSHK